MTSCWQSLHQSEHRLCQAPGKGWERINTMNRDGRSCLKYCRSLSLFLLLGLEGFLFTWSSARSKSKLLQQEDSFSRGIYTFLFKVTTPNEASESQVLSFFPSKKAFRNETVMSALLTSLRTSTARASTISRVPGSSSRCALAASRSSSFHTSSARSTLKETDKSAKKNSVSIFIYQMLTETTSRPRRSGWCIRGCQGRQPPTREGGQTEMEAGTGQRQWGCGKCSFPLTSSDKWTWRLKWYIRSRLIGMKSRFRKSTSRNCRSSRSRSSPSEESYMTSISPNGWSGRKFIIRINCTYIMCRTWHGRFHLLSHDINLQFSARHFYFNWKKQKQKRMKWLWSPRTTDGGAIGW